MSGHFGRDKTVALIQSKVYFPGFRQKTIEFIKSCVACQRVKCGGKFEKGGEKLKPIPVPRMPMRQIGIDCITNLPKTDEGFDTIVTVIDYTSKWPESKPLKGKFAEGVAEFMYEIVCHHGAAKIHILHNQLSILSQFRVEIMCYNNLVVISPTHQLGTSAGGSSHRQYMVQPHYTREQLINI